MKWANFLEKNYLHYEHPYSYKDLQSSSEHTLADEQTFGLTFLLSAEILKNNCIRAHQKNQLKIKKRYFMVPRVGAIFKE